jgi:ATP-dependent helicase/nuclease subunit A
VRSAKSKVRGRKPAQTESGRNTQYELSFAQPGPALPETHRKVATFLERYARWRRLVRQISLARGLEAVLSETHYAEWLLTQPRGEQQHANVQRLLVLARQFDQFQRQSLFRFLCFVEAQQAAEAEPQVAAVSEENAVRLMSIHQSKGLEFPVVVVADLGKTFNEADLRAEIILDERYGLCPQIKPPHTGQRYPSLAYWLARRRQLVELLGEESRLLYVATTRARDTLILSGTISKAKLNKFWHRNGAAEPAALLAARSYADWLGYWFSRNSTLPREGAARGQTEHLRWAVHDDRELAGAPARLQPEEATTDLADAVTSEVWQKLQKRLSWQYPFPVATRTPAKTSVSILRRRATEQLDDEVSSFSVHASRSTRHELPLTSHPSAADIGSAQHRFLECVALERVGSLGDLRSEAQRLVKETAMTENEAALLDLEGLSAFWQSELGQKVRAQREHVRRELEFTARFSCQDVAELTGGRLDADLAGEFVVVQGVVDLAVVLASEMWLIDFKSDRVEERDLAERVKEYEPQLKLYARALSRIYQRPVLECWLYFLSQRKVASIEPG